MITKAKDLHAGLIFIAVAAAFGIGSFSHDLGTAFQMGPGYFPLILSGVLGLLGLVIAFNGFRASGSSIGTVSVRGLLLVPLAPIGFGLTVRELGFAPSIALVVLLGAYASRKTSLVTGIVSALVIALFCWAVFIRGLGLPLPVFGPWADPVMRQFQEVLWPAATPRPFGPAHAGLIGDRP